MVRKNFPRGATVLVAMAAAAMAALFLVGVWEAPANAQATTSTIPSAYTMKDLGAFWASGINDSGQVIGKVSGTANGAVLYDNHHIKYIEADSALGINNTGRITGTKKFDANAESQAYIYDGSMHEIVVGDNIVTSVGTSISDFEQVVGTRIPLGEGDSGSGFLYDNGSVHTIPPLWTDDCCTWYSQPEAINNRSQVVGTGVNSSGQYHGFLYNYDAVGGNSTITDLGAPFGATYSFANDINDSATIVGYRYTLSTRANRALLWSAGGIPYDLGLLGGFRSEAWGINNWDHIVGFSETSDRTQHAFLYGDDQMYDLNTLTKNRGSTEIANATAINDHDQIVANAQVNGVWHALLLTPTKPAPTVTSHTPTDPTDPNIAPTDVRRTIKPTATFSTDMKDTTINAKNIKLQVYNKKKKKWISVAHTVGYDSTSKTAIITPVKSGTTTTVPLAASKKYRVTVTTNVKDTSDTALDQDSTKSGNQPAKWTFTTGTST